MHQDFTSFCEINLQAVEDGDTFKNFKQIEQYRNILEHVNFYQGLQYINEISKTNPFLLQEQNLEKFKSNDFIGNPITEKFPNIGIFSPTIFRYVKVLSDLLLHFGNLDNLNIIELGAGNGGQCNIISKIVNYKKYTIVDLPEVLALQKKCLNLLDTPNVAYKTSDELNKNEKYDLIISNYAFSEVPKELRYFYIDNVLLNSSMGYITMNRENISPFRTELFERLRSKCPVEHEEIPRTAIHNYIVIWR